MEKLHQWDVSSVCILDMARHHVKYITSVDLVEKEKMQKLLAFAQSITGEIVAFTDLAEKDLNLAIALTSKPYYKRRWNC